MNRKNLYCQLCGKTSQMGYNRPKSLHKTARLILPNLQKWNGIMICNRCRKTIRSKVAAQATAATPPTVQK